MIRGSFRKEILLMLGCLNKQTMDPDTWFLFKIFVCFNMAKAVFSTEVKKGFNVSPCSFICAKNYFDQIKRNINFYGNSRFGIGCWI